MELYDDSATAHYILCEPISKLGESKLKSASGDMGRGGPYLLDHKPHDRFEIEKQMMNLDRPIFKPDYRITVMDGWWVWMAAAYYSDHRKIIIMRSIHGYAESGIDGMMWDISLKNGLKAYNKLFAPILSQFSEEDCYLTLNAEDQDDFYAH